MRSTLKCGIISLLNGGVCFMKTKIIYISGNEVFDMADIRAAFEEVRSALNLDKETVLFGVPVDADDAALVADEPESTAEVNTFVEAEEPEEVEEIINPVQDEIVDEPVVEEKQKKRTRKTKVKDIKPESTTEQEETAEQEEKIVPIMSILSVKSEEETPAEPKAEIITQEIEIVQEISEPGLTAETTEEEIPQETVEDIDEQEITDEETDDEADLEKLLSAMTPLQEDIVEDKKEEVTPAEPEYNDDISVDATLEQLATEFAESQDKIATTNKSSSRSKIGKLRNILPFKQSKHKDQGLGDLFGWAGVAANDEDFSVPGFFTNAAAKK